jgi:hypothetical protein
MPSSDGFTAMKLCTIARKGLRQPGADDQETTGARRSNVVPFRLKPPIANRLSIGDRMTALRWAEQSSVHGYSKIVFDTASVASSEESGDFVLLYPSGALWAKWGINCDRHGLKLWHAGSGATLGVFATMGETLAAVPRVG